MLRPTTAWTRQGQDERHVPGDVTADVVSNHRGLLVPEQVHHGDEVADDVEVGVGGDLRGCARATVSPQVRGDDPIASIGERAELLAPGEAELRKAVQE